MRTHDARGRGSGAPPGRTAAAVAIEVARLAQALRVRVFQRTTWHVSPSPVGQAMLEHDMRIMDA